MSNTINFEERSKKLADNKIVKAINELALLHNRKGFAAADAVKHIEESLEYIRRRAYEYYEANYDEDEPDIARHNLMDFLKELEQLANHEGRFVEDK